MADKEIHHVKLHQGAWVWVIPVGVLVYLGGFSWFFREEFKDELNPPESAPYAVDIRSEGAPVTIDYISRWHIVATVERADGKEIRLYNPDDGKLVGTYWESASADAASEEDESGAE